MILQWYFSLHFQRSLIRDKALCIKDISLILYRKMRLWYFFREKRFLRACIYWFFIACVLLSKYHYSLIPFVGRIMFRRHLPFYDCVPSHNFFRNFLAKSFVVSNNICTFVTTYSPPLPFRTARSGWVFFVLFAMFGV